MFISSCWIETPSDQRPSPPTLRFSDPLRQPCPAVEDRQDFVSARRRQADNRSCDAHLAAMLQPARIFGEPPDRNRDGSGVASGFGGHLPEARQEFDHVAILRAA